MTDSWVQRTAAEYAEAIAGELPTGPAWSRDPSNPLMAWVQGCAQIWGDVAAAAALLLVTESDPRLTIDLLPDWERAFGLPDACNSEAQTLETRHAALLARLTMLGGQSRAFFIAVAASIGYTIEIYEFLPIIGGITCGGDTRPAGEVTYEWLRGGVGRGGVDHICNIKLGAGDDWVWQAGPPELRFYWRVVILNTRLTWLRGGVGQGGVDHICEFGLATDLECLIRRYKPAHSQVIFDYSQVAVPTAT